MKSTILVVDDSESIRVLIAETLEGSGFSIVSANNGEEGLQALSQHGIKLVITDLNMPVMDGLSFLKKIRTNEKYRYLPVLILTTESQIQKRREGKESGATGWIVKPFDKNKLLHTVHKVIR